LKAKKDALGLEEREAEQELKVVWELKESTEFKVSKENVDRKDVLVDEESTGKEEPKDVQVQEA